MVNLFSLFLASLRSTISQFIPSRRHQLIELLEQITEDVPPNPGCADILEAWMEEFGSCGFVLGNVSLFLLGFVLMAAVDLILLRWNSVGLSVFLGSVSAFYSLAKFRFSRSSRAINFLILLFLAFWLISGFQWVIAFLTLALFTNIVAFSKAGGFQC